MSKAENKKMLQIYLVTIAIFSTLVGIISIGAMVYQGFISGCITGQGKDFFSCQSLTNAPIGGGSGSNVDDGGGSANTNGGGGGQ